MLRRDFLAGAGAITAGAVAGCSAGGASPARLSAPARAPAALAVDEAYWARVREQFDLAADWIVLSAVVRGAITRAARLRVETEAARLAAFRPREPADRDWRERVRGKAAALIGAAPAEVALTRNATDGITAVLLGWPLAAGDEILTSSFEHAPYYGTLAARAARDGVQVRRLHVPAPAGSPAEIADAVEGALGPRTRLVMLCHVALSGQILPIRDIAERVHARGARLLVDGALSVGHVVVDVGAMDCDFFAGNFHKWAMGPRGTGVLQVKRELIERLVPVHGSVSFESGRMVPQMNSRSMEKFEEFGGHPDAHFHGLEAAIDFLASIGMPAVQARLFALTRHWVDRARSIRRIRFAARTDPSLCAGLMSWEIAGVSSEKLGRALGEKKIALGGTDPVGGFLGIPETRPRWLFLTSTGVFTMREELDRFVDALRGELAT